MPRPKRPKLIHTVPALRGARPTPTSSIKHQVVSLSPASSTRVTTTTDDSDGLVTTQRTASGSRRPAVRDQYTMTGALGEEETKGTRLRPPSIRTIEDVTRTAREAEYANIAADRRKAREIAAANSSDQIQVPSTLQSESGTRPASRIGPSIVQSRRPSMASRGQRTPLAQSSTLGAAIFKKRPRQPSLLQMVQSQQAQSELDHNDDLDDFRPDDESTPLVKSLSQLHGAGTSSSRQTSISRKRKLKTPEIQVPASQSDDLPSSPPANSTQEDELEDGSDPEEASGTRQPVLPPPHNSQSAAPEIFSDTLAPPQSSSSSSPSRSHPTRARNATTQSASNPKTRKQPQRSKHPSKPSANGTTSASASPVRKPLNPLTTAHLQNLLPRRRAQHNPREKRSAYDFPGSSSTDDIHLDATNLSENEDELSFQAASKLRRKPKSKTPARTLPAPPPAATKRGARGANKTKAVPVTTAAAAQQKATRVSTTYTRKSLLEEPADVDDANDEDNSLGPTKSHGKGKGGGGDFDGAAKQEMKRQAAKFAEVDEFTMDFEDVTGSSSQMADAR